MYRFKLAQRLPTCDQWGQAHFLCQYCRFNLLARDKLWAYEFARGQIFLSTDHL
jgi:hypothetical protein